METSRCVVVYKSLKSRQVNFQPLRLFSGIKRIVFSLLRLKFGQRAGKQELEMQVFIQEQSKVPSRPLIFLSTSPAASPIHWFVKDPFSTLK